MEQSNNQTTPPNSTSNPENKGDTSTTKIPEQSGSENMIINEENKRIILKLIGKYPIFNSFSEEEANRFVSYCTHRNIQPADVVFHQGDKDAHVYVMLRGQVQVLVNDEEVNRIGAGEAFGELGLLQKRTKTATIKALEESDVLIIDQSQLYEMEPQILIKLISYFLKRVSDRFIGLEQTHLRLKAELDQFKSKQSESLSETPPTHALSIPDHSSDFDTLGTKLGHIENQVGKLIQHDQDVHTPLNELKEQMQQQHEQLTQINKQQQNLDTLTKNVPFYLILILALLIALILGIGVIGYLSIQYIQLFGG
jgi:CRP-like cAMP-binding protein